MFVRNVLRAATIIAASRHESPCQHWWGGLPCAWEFLETKSELHVAWSPGSLECAWTDRCTTNQQYFSLQVALKQASNQVLWELRELNLV